MPMIGERKGILVIGNLNVDRIYSVPRIPSEGQSVPVSDESVRFGGCGGNIALAAARLGMRTRLSSVVGEDLDPGYMERVQGSGIDASDVVKLPGHRSPFCIILSAPGGKQAYAFHMGAMSEQGRAPIPDPGEVAYCHVATSDPTYTAKVLAAMKRAYVETGLDPGQEIFFRWGKKEMNAALKSTDRFFGNIGEWTKLGEIMGWERVGDDVPVFREAFGYIREAIITMGEKGAALIRSSETFTDPAFSAVRLIDATGAGDAFRGAFYAALERGYGSHKALHYGNMMGGYITGVEGPQEYSIGWEDLSSLEDR
jgi:sugar/nucleoside kinase (ribokinase family)